MVLRILTVVFAALLAILLANPAAATSVTGQSIDSATSGPATGPAAPAGGSVTRDESGRATVRAVRLTEPLRLDGRLDEEIYRTVPPSDGFVQQVPQQGAAATEAT